VELPPAGTMAFVRPASGVAAGLAGWWVGKAARAGIAARRVQQA